MCGAPALLPCCRAENHNPTALLWRPPPSHWVNAAPLPPRQSSTAGTPTALPEMVGGKRLFDPGSLQEKELELIATHPFSTKHLCCSVLLSCSSSHKSHVQSLIAPWLHWGGVGCPPGAAPQAGCRSIKAGTAQPTRGAPHRLCGSSAPDVMAHWGSTSRGCLGPGLSTPSLAGPGQQQGCRRAPACDLLRTCSWHRAAIYNQPAV